MVFSNGCRQKKREVRHFKAEVRVLVVVGLSHSVS